MVDDLRRAQERQAHEAARQNAMQNAQGRAQPAPGSAGAINPPARNKEERSDERGRGVPRAKRGGTTSTR